MEVDKKAYGKYVDEITPKHNLPLNMARAFLTGGAVCTCLLYTSDAADD